MITKVSSENLTRNREGGTFSNSNCLFNREIKSVKRVNIVRSFGMGQIGCSKMLQRLTFEKCC